MNLEVGGDLYALGKRVPPSAYVAERSILL